MATAVSAVVNGGYLVTPYVVGSMTDDAGNVVSETQPNIRRQVISEDVSQQLCAMMENNVGGGKEGYSCRNVYVAGYSIGGKSGTAEQLDRSERSDGDYHKQISFAAVLPADDPEILVFAVLDDPRWVEDFASQIVAPMVGNIISEIAPYLGIPRDPDYVEPESITVPNAVGSRWSLAQANLNKLGLGHQLIGSGSEIVYQYPYSGTSVPAESTIYFYTDSTTGSRTTVPDVTGKTGTFASQMLKSANLNVKLVGDANGKVVSQDVAAASSVEFGTIVTIQTETDTSADTTNTTQTDTATQTDNEEGTE